jgi:hypothetical protein
MEIFRITFHWIRWLFPILSRLESIINGTLTNRQTTDLPILKTPPTLPLALPYDIESNSVFLQCFLEEISKFTNGSLIQ